VADGRVVLNDVEPEGLSAGAGGNTSDIRVAELFLEVICAMCLGGRLKSIK